MLIKFDNEADWLEARKQDVTSTEAAALFGLNPYKSRLKLWHIKAGNINDDFEESPFSVWGRRLQLPVGLGICEDEGWEGFDLTGYYLRDPSINSGSSLDMRVQCRARGRGHLEIKVAEEFRESDGWGKNSAPLWYEFQMQMQMHEAHKHGDPFDFSCLGTLGRRQQTRLLFRQYDPKAGELIDNEIKEFWASIKADKPPAPDYAADGDILSLLAKPVRAGEGRNLSQDNRAVELIHEYAALEQAAKPHLEKIKEFNAKKIAIKNELHYKIGNAETAIIGDYIVSAKEQIVEEFFNPGHKMRRFDVKKRK